ncbi:MAG TPA: hypothetical protein VIV60_08120 [Polyangiaceae bacterium]
MTSDELVIRDLFCDAAEIVYVKSIATAYEGLCCLFASSGKSVSLVAPKGREAELDLLVDDLVEELKLRRIAQVRSQKSR